MKNRDVVQTHTKNLHLPFKDDEWPSGVLLYFSPGKPTLCFCISQSGNSGCTELGAMFTSALK